MRGKNPRLKVKNDTEEVLAKKKNLTNVGCLHRQTYRRMFIESVNIWRDDLF